MGEMTVRLTLLTIGARGDVQPLVALGQGLRRAGYDVRIATFESFRPLVERAGLVLAPLAGVAQEVTETKEAKDMLDSGENIFKHVRAIRAISRKLIQTPGYWESFENACQDAQAIIYNYTAPQGFHLAEKFKIPGIQVASTPAIVPTGAFPHPFWMGNPKLGPAFNRLTHAACEQFMWQPFRTMINKWRREHLHLPPSPFPGPYAAMRRSPVLYSFPESVIPRPRDWNERVELTGFWYLEPSDWQPDRRLIDFIAGGPAPVYVGFGSVGVRDEKGTLRLAQEALRMCGQRAVVGVRASLRSSLEASNDFLPIDDVPFDWLFTRVAAVIHHGGAGTTAAAMRAGIPNVVFPHFSDQPFWGRRVAALGVGPEPIPGKELTAGRLAAAIKTALTDSAMRQRAARLGEKIRMENGVQRAVEAITRFLGNPSLTHRL
jgi:sterol 3beta-glucosyltransferase